MNRFEVFEKGVEILTPLLRSHGFEFQGAYTHLYPSIVGRGEEVVRGEFARDRRLELELWYSLRQVTYRLGELWLDHKSYMKALGVREGANAYPGFSDNPLDAFNHLRSDLECYGREFLAGDAPIFRAAAAQEAALRPAQQRRYTARMVGDDAARQEARQLFHARKFAEVVALLETLKYPEFMDEYERKILKLSRHNAGIE